MCRKILLCVSLAAVCLTACKKETELIDDFTTTTAFQTSAYGTAEQTSPAAAEASEGLPRIVIGSYGANRYEAAAASESNVPETEAADENFPEIRDPVSAVKKYIEELSESESVEYIELHETRIGQSSTAANKYYESPLAEKFGVTEDTFLVPVNVDYYIEYAENSELESGEKSDYFIVDQNINGFYVIDTFPYDPQDYYGEIKEVLPDEENHGVRYLVELDGGLGTVICSNAAMYGEFEAGTRIYIEANGDIYGETPVLDAIFMCRESELPDDERKEQFLLR